MSENQNYQVLARKYRPQTFSELTGQEHVSRTLQNAIDTGRVAHAFLFTGARGVGKTSTARILARALNCEKGLSTEPCNVCPHCIEIRDGISTDVFEIDGASNTGVDDIRELRDNVRYLPSHSRYKIFIIDEVHMLSNNAFNALLKTLEEPPAHVKFIFATTEPHKLPVTILSRCQRLDFRRVGISAIVGRLRGIAEQEKITVSDESLALIARKGDGSMRDSLTAFDQVLAFCGSEIAENDVAAVIGSVDRKLILSLSEALVTGDCTTVLNSVKSVDAVGYSMRQFVQELIEHLRALLITLSVNAPEDIIDVADAELAELKKIAASTSQTDVQRRMTLLIKADSDMAFSPLQKTILEIALLKAAMLVPVLPIQELVQKIRLLETGASQTVQLPFKEPQSKPDRTVQQQTKTAAAPTSHKLQETLEKKPLQHQKGNLSTVSDWERFVEFCYSRIPATASILEHGSPVKIESGMLEIGFPASSYYLTAAQDKSVIDDTEKLAVEFSGNRTVVKIKGLSAEAETPLSIIEKKTSESEVKLAELKQSMESHPVVIEAKRVFGAELSNFKTI